VAASYFEGRVLDLLPSSHADSTCSLIWATFVNLYPPPSKRVLQLLRKVATLVFHVVWYVAGVQQTSGQGMDLFQDKGGKKQVPIHKENVTEADTDCP
jgi:hypothetical protein